MERCSDTPVAHAEQIGSEHAVAFKRGAARLIVGFLLLVVGISVVALAVADEGSQAFHTSAEQPGKDGRALSVPLQPADPADPKPPPGGMVIVMWGLVLGPSAVILALWAAQRFVPKMSVWTGLSISTYLLLAPGLLCKIWDYRITGMSGTMEIKNKHESIGDFAVGLTQEGGMGWFGAIMVVLYAVVIPAVKLLLLVAAELWRNGSPKQVRWARKFVIVLKAISKWASPDIFAYVILIHLVRSLTHEIDFWGMPMEAMRGVGELRLGFTGFATFCVFSTIATLGLRTPEEPQDAREVATEEGACQRCLRWRPSGKSLVALVCVLFAAFAVLLCTGLQMPCMALSVNMEPMNEPNGPIPLSMKDMVESFQLEEISKTDVSMWACITELASRVAHGGGPNDCIALGLYVVFVIAFTALDMFILVIAAFQQHFRTWEEATDSEHLFSALGVSHALKKLSMMDVALVGLFLILCCGSVYEKEGLSLHFRWGLFVLFCAEACHYLTYFLVSRAAPQASKQAAAKQAEELEDNPSNREEEDSSSMSGTVV